MKEKLYFLGIGGIGMSALARWYRARGAEVAGYDKTPTPLTRKLEDEGISVDHSGAITALPLSLREDLSTGCATDWTLVWTPAIPAGFPLLQAFQKAGYTLHKRAQILGRITRNRPLLAVAGTHGKTTTSTLLAHILEHNGTPVDAFLGGIALGHGSNLIISTADTEETWVVAEADEYDRSFLHLHPTHAAITSVDPDHLDIYGSHEQVMSAFAAFARQVAPGGTLVHADAATALNAALAEDRNENGDDQPERIPPAQYGHLTTGATLRQTGWVAGYEQPHSHGQQTRFTLHLAGTDPVEVAWRLPGHHNAANATAAAHLARCAGLSAEQIATALEAFPGVARRFQVRHQSPGRVVVDDYAHHPSEIAGTISAARSAYPNRRITGVFQPHLYSRTRDFLDGFATALSALDACVLLPIYAAREEPLPGVDAQAIGEKMVGCTVKSPEESRFLDVLEELDPDVLLFMGAGDLDRWIDPVWERLERKQTPPSIDAQ